MTSSDTEKSCENLEGLEVELNSILNHREGKRIAVIGYDAFILNNDSSKKTLYDAIIEEFNKEIPEEKNNDILKHDIFYAIEKWKYIKRESDERVVVRKINKIIENHSNDEFPIIDKLAQLPFDLYISVGMDNILEKKLRKYHRWPEKIHFIGKYRKKISKVTRTKRTVEIPSTSHRPFIGNLLGNCTEGTSGVVTGYDRLMELITNTGDSKFLDKRTKSELRKKGVLFYCGVPLDYWYIGSLLHPFFISNHENTTEAAELKRRTKITSTSMCDYLNRSVKVNSDMYCHKKINEILMRTCKKHPLKKEVKVFICYTQADMPKMKEVKNAVKENKICHNIIYECNDFSTSPDYAGGNWKDNREKLIRDCDLFIFIGTNNIQTDSDCNKELIILRRSITDDKKEIEVLPLYNNISTTHFSEINILELQPYYPWGEEPTNQVDQCIYEKINKINEMKSEING